MQGCEIEVADLAEETLMPVSVGVIEQITLFVPQNLVGRVIVSLNGVTAIINVLIDNRKDAHYPHITFFTNLVIDKPSDLVCYFYLIDNKDKGKKINITYLQQVA